MFGSINFTGSVAAVGYELCSVELCRALNACRSSIAKYKALNKIWTEQFRVNPQIESIEPLIRAIIDSKVRKYLYDTSYPIFRLRNLDFTVFHLNSPSLISLSINLKMIFIFQNQHNFTSEYFLFRRLVELICISNTENGFKSNTNRFSQLFIFNLITKYSE